MILSKPDDYFKYKIAVLEAENARLRETLKEVYRAGLNGDEHAGSIMVAEMLEELGYEFDSDGRLIDDEDDD